MFPTHTLLLFAAKKSTLFKHCTPERQRQILSVRQQEF
jgi:hypothetical protein